MQKKLTKSFLSLAFVAATLATAPTASAAPIADCNTWKSNNAPYTASAYCSKLAMADKFRVKATCIDPRGNQWFHYGPWKKNTKTSTAKCSDNPNVGVLKVSVVFKA